MLQQQREKTICERCRSHMCTHLYVSMRVFPRLLQEDKLKNKKKKKMGEKKKVPKTLWHRRPLRNITSENKIHGAWREIATCNGKYKQAERKSSTSSCSCGIFVNVNVAFLYLKKNNQPNKPQPDPKHKVLLCIQKLLLRAPRMGMLGFRVGHPPGNLPQPQAGKGARLSLPTKDKSAPLTLLSSSLPITPIKGHPADEKTSPALIAAVTTCSRRSSVIRSHPGSGVTHSSCHLSSALSPQMPFN